MEDWFCMITVFTQNNLSYHKVIITCKCMHTPRPRGRPCRKTCLGCALIFKRWCCQCTLSRCTLAHTGALSSLPERGAAETTEQEMLYTQRRIESLRIDRIDNVFKKDGNWEVQVRNALQKGGRQISSSPLFPPQMQPGPSSPGRN